MEATELLVNLHCMVQDGHKVTAFPHCNVTDITEHCVYVWAVVLELTATSGLTRLPLYI
jgi:hypothetical protein